MLEIEIVEVNIIDGGIEVFARAWNEHGQIGFGTDGSVDIERFRIFNPPVLVEDPNGDIVRIQQADAETGVKYREFTYREDPEEALLLSLESTLVNMKNISGSDSIIPGKRGRTTSTFYADTAGDGYIETTNQGLNWDAAHDVTSGTTVNDTAATQQSRILWGGANVVIGRLFFPFDTAAIPDTDVISSATFSFKATTNSIEDNDAQAYWGLVGPTTQASVTGLVASDFSKCADINSPNEVSDTQVSLSGLTDSSYTDMPLNASGLSNIVVDGYTKFGVREGHDIEDISITATAGIQNSSNFLMADTTGTTSDPKLVVEHAAGGGGANLSARRQHLMMM